MKRDDLEPDGSLTTNRLICGSLRTILSAILVLSETAYCTLIDHSESDRRLEIVGQNRQERPPWSDNSCGRSTQLVREN